MSDRQEQERSLVVAPIIVREIGGTVYPVYGYFSPEARETAGEKKSGVCLPERQRRKYPEALKIQGFVGLSDGFVV